MLCYLEWLGKASLIKLGNLADIQRRDVVSLTDMGKGGVIFPARGFSKFWSKNVLLVRRTSPGSVWSHWGSLGASSYEFKTTLYRTCGQEEAPANI